MKGLIERLCFVGFAAGTIALASGCSIASPGGFELGGKLGLYSVDERSESTQVVTKNVPWKCRFTNCENQEVARGS